MTLHLFTNLVVQHCAQPRDQGGEGADAIPANLGERQCPKGGFPLGTS